MVVLEFKMLMMIYRIAIDIFVFFTLLAIERFLGRGDAKQCLISWRGIILYAEKLLI